jgi:hypothetical protein
VICLILMLLLAAPVENSEPVQRERYGEVLPHAER